MDHQKFNHATQRLAEAAANRRQAHIDALERELADADARGDVAVAKVALETFLVRQPRESRRWHELACIRHQAGDTDDALAAWRHALVGDITQVNLLHDIGTGLSSCGVDPAGFASHAWEQDEAGVVPPRDSLRAPRFRDACLALLRGQMQDAIELFGDMAQDQPMDARLAGNFRWLLEQAGRHGMAECARARHLLAHGWAGEAAAAFEAAPSADSRSARFLPDFLRALRLSGNEQRALDILASQPEAAIPRLARIEWADILSDIGRIDQAILVLRRGAEVLADPGLALSADLLLPAVPATQEAMERAHARVRSNLLALANAPLPASPGELEKLAASLKPNFLLAYMPEACVEEARAYGTYVGRVTAARFPEPDPLPQGVGRSRGAEPLKIGIATSFMNHHVVMKTFANWLQQADRGGLEIHLFPLETEQNDVTRYLSGLADVFHPGTSSVRTAARQIRDSGLDLLAYPEVGMNTLTFQLAAMRLARVQCVGGAHPSTTGLSTLDYFLSAAAAEPANAASHYTERLVALPGMAVCMPQPILPDACKARAEFGLSSRDVVYFSPQSLFKYLPKHDAIYATIARRVGNAVFVFVEGHFPAWTRTFSARQRHHFAAAGLDPDRHLRFVAKQDYADYLCLTMVSDVFLDPPGGFSGGMTCRDALACGLPVLTLPGNLMRTRQGYGLLSELGVEDTIATSVEDYIERAVQLGNAPEARLSISRRIEARRHVIFDDARCARALEMFLRWGSQADPQDEVMMPGLDGPRLA